MNSIYSNLNVMLLSILLLDLIFETLGLNVSIFVDDFITISDT